MTQGGVSRERIDSTRSQCRHRFGIAFGVFHSAGKCMNRVIEALREYATNGTAENFRLP